MPFDMQRPLCIFIPKITQLCTLSALLQVTFFTVHVLIQLFVLSPLTWHICSNVKLFITFCLYYGRCLIHSASFCTKNTGLVWTSTPKWGGRGGGVICLKNSWMHVWRIETNMCRMTAVQCEPVERGHKNSAWHWATVWMETQDVKNRRMLLGLLGRTGTRMHVRIGLPAEKTQNRCTFPK